MTIEADTSKANARRELQELIHSVRWPQEPIECDDTGEGICRKLADAILAAGWRKQEPRFTVVHEDHWSDYRVQDLHAKLGQWLTIAHFNVKEDAEAYAAWRNGEVTK